MIKKILLVLASLFLVCQSYGILRMVSEIDSNSWLLNLFTAWILNLFICGIFAFSVFGFPIEKLFPKSYYHVSNPVLLKKIYKTLRVDTFRKLLLATLWKNTAQRKRFYDGTLNGLAHLDMRSKKSEFGHAVPFIIMITISAYLVLIGRVKLAVFSMAINIIGNLYPILLQRHHRMRTTALKQRLKR